MGTSLINANGAFVFTGTFNSKVKKELVIFVTPHIVRANETSAQDVAGVQRKPGPGSAEKEWLNTP